MQIAILPSWYPNNYQPHLGTFIKEQHKLLLENGMDVHLLGAIPISVRYGFRPKPINIDDTKYIEFFRSIPGLRRWGALETKRRGLKLFHNYVKEYGVPDILHVHSYLQGYFALVLHQRYHIPFVVTEHYTRLLDTRQLKSWEKELCSMLYSTSEANYAVSDYYARILTKGFGVKFNSIPNFIDVEKFSLAEKPFGLKKFRIVTVGGLTKRKGMDILLKSISILNTEGVNVNLEIIGSGVEEADLKKLSSTLGLDGKVRFIPFVPNDVLPKHFQVADCFVLASDVETFGVVVIEALACGTPVVVTADAPRMFIREGVNGCFSERHPSALAINIKHCLGIRTDPVEIRREIVQKYSPVAVSKLLNKEYSRVLGKEIK